MRTRSSSQPAQVRAGHERSGTVRARLATRSTNGDQARSTSFGPVADPPYGTNVGVTRTAVRTAFTAFLSPVPFS